jgi:hypothetical protein
MSVRQNLRFKPQLRKLQLKKPALKTVPRLDGVPPKETTPLEILGVVAHQHSPDGLGFISDYANYVDVLEAPRMLHEMVAIQVVASVLNRNGVVIPHGSLTYPLDLWMVLLSGSGHGRSTVVNIARPLLKTANLPDSFGMQTGEVNPRLSWIGGVSLGRGGIFALSGHQYCRREETKPTHHRGYKSRLVAFP